MVRSALGSGEVEVLLKEKRVFAPSREFTAQANVNDETLYQKALAGHESFWAECAKALDWFAPWKQVLESTPPYYRWFTEGKLNVSYNCLDRHIKTPLCNKAALIWEG